jgi:hypothetical protein
LHQRWSTLTAGGGALATWAAIELADSHTEPEESADADDPPGTDDTDSAEKVMLGGGLAAVGVGAIVLMTGGRSSNPAVSPRAARFAITHTVRF